MKIFAVLREYLHRSKELHEPTVPIRAKLLPK
jgi:hypothetical protein